MRSVLSLVLPFLPWQVFGCCCEAEFLSLILVLVYVGAVMTLFLFVVMMLNIDKEDLRRRICALFTVWHHYCCCCMAGLIISDSWAHIILV